MEGWAVEDYTGHVRAKVLSCSQGTSFVSQETQFMASKSLLELQRQSIAIVPHLTEAAEQNKRDMGQSTPAWSPETSRPPVLSPGGVELQ